MIKAFERIPHSVLAREAKELGYPMWMLRLSIAAYKLMRVVRVGTTVSIEVAAIRGITVGSGMATTEMRIMLINIFDVAIAVHPMVVITVYVDDISGEIPALDDHIVKELGDCISEICLGAGGQSPRTLKDEMRLQCLDGQAWQSIGRRVVPPGYLL